MCLNQNKNIDYCLNKKMVAKYGFNKQCSEYVTEEAERIKGQIS